MEIVTGIQCASVKPYLLAKRTLTKYAIWPFSNASGGCIHAFPFVPLVPFELFFVFDCVVFWAHFNNVDIIPVTITKLPSIFFKHNELTFCLQDFVINHVLLPIVCNYHN